MKIKRNPPKIRNAILVLAVLIAIGMAIFPPLKYGWFIEKRPARLSRGWRVDTEKLVLHYFLLTGATALLLFATRGKSGGRK
jgi:hypothetical protein